MGIFGVAVLSNIWGFLSGELLHYKALTDTLYHCLSLKTNIIQAQLFMKHIIIIFMLSPNFKRNEN